MAATIIDMGQYETDWVGFNFEMYNCREFKAVYDNVKYQIHCANDFEW